MLGQNYIQDLALRSISTYKRTPSGFLSFNCPACIHRGEPRQDTKQRMGLLVDPNGGVRYHCFRCHCSAGWKPGFFLSNNFKQLLGWLGIPSNDIAQANLEALRIKQEYQEKNIILEDDETLATEVNLPDGSKKIEYWASLVNPPEKFVSCIKWMSKRNPKLFEWSEDWYWSDTMQEHLIIPLRHQDMIYGWSARLCRPQKKDTEPKYLMNDAQNKFLYNADLLSESLTNYVLVCEGPLDGIALNSVALLGNEVSKEQMKWFKNCNKEIIVFPDKDQGGEMLINTALKMGWSVSMPTVFQGSGCKDGFDVVSKYGRLFSVKTIIDSRVSNPLKINLIRKQYFE